MADMFRFTFRLPIWLVLAGFLALTPSVSWAAAPHPLIQAINAVRGDHRLGYFRYSFTLTRAAERHARDMFARQYFSHTTPTGRPFRTWLADGPASFRSVGENLAIGQSSFADVLAAWQSSGPHRQNLFSTTLTHAGVAFLTGPWQGRPTTIAVAMFGGL